jgi:molybdate transport system ATP-binding protein
MTLDAAVTVRRGEFLLDVEFSAADGETLVVVGPNGAGKTTLLHALAGLVPVDEGRIVVDGVVVDEPATATFVPPERRPVGVVFQDDRLFPHLDALDNVAFGLRERGVRRREARARARQLLDAVDLVSRARARPHELSGGEAQRVAIARTLAIEPHVLLLDEPLAALDVEREVEIRHTLTRVFGRFGGPRIVVAHEPVAALTLADRIVVLHDGRVAQVGTPDDVVARPRSSFVAELVGTNLYRGDARDGEVHLGGGVVLTAPAATPHRGAVLAVVAPHAVVLHTEEPHGSARNVLRGAIVAIDRLGTRVRVRVDGAVPVVAEVTPAAVSALGLREGESVWAAVKATEVEVHPA